MPRPKKLSPLTTIPYLLFFLLLSVWAVRQPQYTWDVVGYVGASIPSSSPEFVYEQTFLVMKPVIANTNNAEVQPDNKYRADVVANPYHFAEQLPFYSIKPLYVDLIRGFHRLGLPYPQSAVAISAAASFLLAVLLWMWLSPYLAGLPLVACCTMIMLSPNILGLARWATPDCLATFIAAVGFYLILERKLYFWGCAILVCDIWIRTDALVLAGVIFFVLWVRAKLDFSQFVSLCALSLGSYFAINHFAGNYGWPALFKNSFMGGITNPGEIMIHISRSDYVHQVVRGAYLWLISGSFALYLLLGGLAVWLNRASVYSDMVVSTLATRVICYFLYPNGDQRYTAVQFVLIPVALVIGVCFAQHRSTTRIAGNTEVDTISSGLRHSHEVSGVTSR
jgi:hypothetical protein